jgi:hypothetical protein
LYGYTVKSFFKIYSAHDYVVEAPLNPLILYLKKNLSFTSFRINFVNYKVNSVIQPQHGASSGCG